MPYVSAHSNITAPISSATSSVTACAVQRKTQDASSSTSAAEIEFKKVLKQHGVQNVDKTSDALKACGISNEQDFSYADDAMRTELENELAAKGVPLLDRIKVRDLGTDDTVAIGIGGPKTYFMPWADVHPNIKAPISKLPVPGVPSAAKSAIS